MTRISPASEKQLTASKDLLALAAAAMGFEANSLKVMARQPAILQGFMGLSAAILGPNASLDPVLRQMIAHISSAAAGCAYCQAHTAHGAEVNHGFLCTHDDRPEYRCPRPSHAR